MEAFGLKSSAQLATDHMADHHPSTAVSSFLAGVETSDGSHVKSQDFLVIAMAFTTAVIYMVATR